MDIVPTLASQFTPLKDRDEFITRLNLQRKLNQVTNYPVTFIHAGAGYGKSVGLSQYVHSTKDNVSWYTVSEYDQDLVFFMAKLIHAVKGSYSTFGEELVNKLGHSERSIKDRDIWSLVTEFVDELEQIDELTIVIDHIQVVFQTPKVVKWVELLLENIPSHIHIILSSRYKPSWGCLSQLKVRGELLEITPSDLKLTEEEIDHLFCDLYNFQINEEEIQRIYRLTEGWPAACSIFIQQLEQGDHIINGFQENELYRSSLDDYMLHEVLNKQPKLTQTFLIQTSILDELSGASCDNLLKVGGSDEILNTLLKQNLMISKIGTEQYQYHPLFKTFLVRRLQSISHQEYNQLQYEAAHYYYKKGDVELAIGHYLEVQEYEEVSELLETYGIKMLNDGQLETLNNYLKKLPEYEIERTTILLYFKAEIARYRSRYDEAELIYQQVIDQSRERDHLYLLSLAYEGKAKIYLDTIRPIQAKRILERAIEYREQLAVDEKELARLYYMLGENLLNLGSANKAETWLEKAKDANLPVDQVNLKARIYLRTGRLKQAKQYLIEQKERFSSENMSQLPKSHRETDILLSIICCMLGESEEGKKYAEYGLQQGIENNSPFVEACGWMRLGHASHLLERYDSETIQTCYKQALNIMQNLNVSRGMAEPYMGLCLMYGNEGKYEQALEAGQNGLKETEKVHDQWLSALILLCLGLAAAYGNRPEQAKQFFNEARSHFESCEDQHGLMVINFWEAYLAFQENDTKLFKTCFSKFLTIMQTGDYEFFLKSRTLTGPQDLQVIAPMFHYCLKENIHRSYVIRLIDELDLGQLEHHPGYTLQIKTLGSFEVKIGRQLVQDWQRDKAKELLELFVTKRHKVLAKEEIFESLWPGETEESANKKFKVTLNSLLKVLEPKRRVRQESYFIERNGSTYRINPESTYELDLDDFERYVEAGLDEQVPSKSRHLLVKGLTLYEGDYLAHRRTADWVVSERERIQVQYLQAAEKLAQIATRLEEYELCLKWCFKILQIDQTWEEAYRLIMYSYYRQDNRPQAIKWFNKCQSVLIEELDIEPTQATIDMHELIK
ncbi:BTAD domain-containing putative transcriptional regulator [Alkalibacillus haloalkaliphilus]|uniref:Transcriptional activator n=1 Tax=Alkalibacillus haloalkaliphilus TaxID=94136 RepID=A0A511W1Z2_9BACI|nr:BTAD domain-containing putative transcriptional regulator [Alkalibacillus haloalkaliphilus]GEN44791.1 transcriptional activator [Alkalibacillus haloalkaliphilus]